MEEGHMGTRKENLERGNSVCKGSKCTAFTEEEEEHRDEEDRLNGNAELRV
jgi:hypothetical protein